jgi:DNA-binding response OmpR family regulator
MQVERVPALILSVDNQEISLQVRQKVLESANHEVVSTTSAESALQLFLALSINLVVLNYHLGATTGVALAREMKRLKPHVPILLVSGGTERPEGYELCDHFMHKSFGPESLLQCVDALLRAARDRRRLQDSPSLVDATTATSVAVSKPIRRVCTMAFRSRKRDFPVAVVKMCVQDAMNTSLHV